MDSTDRDVSAGTSATAAASSPRRRQGLAGLPMKTQVTFLVIIAILPTGLILSAYFYLVINPQLREGIEARALNLAGYLGDAIVRDGSFDGDAVDRTVGRILMQSDHRLAYVVVYRGDDPVPYREHMVAVPHQYTEAIRREIVTVREESIRTIGQGPVAYIDATVPLGDAGTLGAVHVGLTTNDLSRREVEYRLLFVAVVLTAFGITGIGASWLVPRITRPLSRLAATAERVGQGDLTDVADFPAGSTEVERLKVSVIQMVEALRRAQAEREQLNRQLMAADRLAAVGQVAAGIAHEINNPLDGARELVRHLAAAPEDAGRVREMAPVVVESLDRIAQVVRQMLDFARPDTGDTRCVTLAEVIDQSHSLLVARLQRRNIGFEASGELEAGVRADVGLLVQLFLNLFINAIDAITSDREVHPERPPDRLAVHVTSSGETVTIWVVDTGPGVDPAIRERLFEPFVTTKPAGQGTGLGLAVSRSLVESACAGTLELVDATEVPPPLRDLPGAVFRVQIPRSSDST